MVKFENISFGYKREAPVFNGLSFTIEKPEQKGHIVGLMGDSGSGKSTLFKLLLGIEKIWSGKIEIQPNNYSISYVPQEPILFEHLSPQENAMYFSNTKRYSKLFDKKRFDDMVKTLGMKHLLERAKSVKDISGGEKQRIALLRALSINPDILLLDEPLTGLDERVKNSFLTILNQLADEYHLLAIYATHHRNEVELFANEILYLVNDEKMGYVSEAVLYPPSIFFKTPPTISALFVSKKHDTNVFPITIDSHQRINLCKDPETNTEDTFYISVPENSIHFSDNAGWKFNISAENDSFIFLQLKGSQTILTLPLSRKESMQNGMGILVDGIVNIYQKGRYINTNRIINNTIIK